MTKAELFDVLKEQLFDRLINFDAQRKELFSAVNSAKIEDICASWPDFAKSCALALNQIATASRLERYEYQETLTDNIKSLKSNPKALEVVSRSRDQSILLEFFARVLSLLYYDCFGIYFHKLYSRTSSKWGCITYTMGEHFFSKLQ